MGFVTLMKLIRPFSGVWVSMAGKTGRRGHNEGAIYQRADGRWAGAVHHGWEGGMRKRKVVYGKTRNEISEERPIEGDPVLPAAG